MISTKYTLSANKFSLNISELAIDRVAERTNIFIAADVTTSRLKLQLLSIQRGHLLALTMLIALLTIPIFVLLTDLKDDNHVSAMLL